MPISNSKVEYGDKERIYREYEGMAQGGILLIKSIKTKDSN